MSATRIPLTFETIAFTSGDVTLEGTLVLPEGDGAHPVVVIQPGSSWILRESAESLETAITFAAYGIAGLAYDKRGYGSSSGATLVSFEVTASDAAAAAEALTDRFDVNPDWIGIWGLSQGAWIAPLAAMRSDAIRYVVLVGAPGTSPARQEIQRARTRAIAERLPPEDVEAVTRFQELSFRYGDTGLGWEEYARARAAAEGRPWLRWVWAPTAPGFDNFGWGRLNGSYNPLPALLALREPVLALWGEHDVNVEPEVHRSIFEVALDAAGNRDFTLRIVPMPTTSSRSPPPRRPPTFRIASRQESGIRSSAGCGSGRSVRRSYETRGMTGHPSLVGRGAGVKCKSDLQSAHDPTSPGIPSPRDGGHHARSGRHGTPAIGQDHPLPGCVPGSRVCLVGAPRHAGLRRPGSAWFPP